MQHPTRSIRRAIVIGCVVAARSLLLTAQMPPAVRFVDSLTISGVQIRLGGIGGDKVVVEYVARGSIGGGFASADAYAELADSITAIVNARDPRAVGAQLSYMAAKGLIGFTRTVRDGDDVMSIFLHSPRGETERLAATKSDALRLVVALRRAIVQADVMSELRNRYRPEMPRPIAVDNQIFFEFQVDKIARVAPNQGGPTYPLALRSTRDVGEVLAQFVVDTAGHADLKEFKVLKSAHPLFTGAVKAWLGAARFVPAEIGARKVRQLVQLPFRFAPDSSADKNY